MNVDQLRLRASRHGRDPEHGRHVRLELDRDRRAEAAERRRRPRARSLLALAAARLGVPVAVAGRLAAGSSRAAAGRSPTASSSSGGCSGCALPAPLLAAGQRRRRSRSPPTGSSGSRGCRGSTSRRRWRAPTSTSTTCACRGCCTARLVRPLGQGAYGDGTLARRRLGRRELDRRARRRARRAARRPPRGRRLAGVRRDPGGGAAAGRLRATRRRDLRERGPLRADARARRGRAGAGAHAGPRRAIVDAALAAAAHTVSAELRLPLPGPHADRPELRGRRRHACAAAIVLCNTQDAYAMRDKLALVLGLPTEPDPRPVLGGRELVRQRPGALRHRRGGGDPLAARRRAGAASVHALGRARLGQLRPGGARRPAPGVPTSAGNIVGFDYTALEHPADVDGLGRRRCRTSASRLHPPGLGSADGLNSGHAVRDAELAA